MKKILSVVFLSMVFGSCYYDKEEYLYPNDFIVIGNVTYANDIKTIIGSNCAQSGCHISGAQSPDLSTYNGLKANVGTASNPGKVETRAIIQQTMPAAGPMSTTNIKKLQKWINEGAQNN